MFSLIYAWINDWVNNREAGDLRRQHGHYDVIVMITIFSLNIAHLKYNSNLTGADKLKRHCILSCLYCTETSPWPWCSLLFYRYLDINQIDTLPQEMETLSATRYLWVLSCPHVFIFIRDEENEWIRNSPMFIWKLGPVVHFMDDTKMIIVKYMPDNFILVHGSAFPLNISMLSFPCNSAQLPSTNYCCYLNKW